MSFVRQCLKRFMGSCLPPNRFLLRGRKTAGMMPSISLSFDDGPHPKHTAQLLDLLGDLRIRGTFFVIGSKLAEFPRLARRIVAEGHELGNHSWTHSDPGQTNSDRFIKEVADTSRVIREVCGMECRLVRPPHGKLTWAKMRGIWRQGQTVALWNVDSRDFQMASHEEARAWCDQYRPSHGDILLFHDDRPFAHAMLQELHRRGVFDRWECVPVSDWAGLKSREFQAGTRAEHSKICGPGDQGAC